MLLYSIAIGGRSGKGDRAIGAKFPYLRLRFCTLESCQPKREPTDNETHAPDRGNDTQNFGRAETEGIKAATEQHHPQQGRHPGDREARGHGFGHRAHRHRNHPQQQRMDELIAGSRFKNRQGAIAQFFR